MGWSRPFAVDQDKTGRRRCKWDHCGTPKWRRRRRGREGPEGGEGIRGEIRKREENSMREMGEEERYA